MKEQLNHTKKETQWKDTVKEQLKRPEFLKALEINGIKVVNVGDDNYPGKLLPFSHKPDFLFYKGNLPKENLPTVAMVGARACSNYGRNMAKKIGKELSDRGVQVISGMARGIDTYSQIGALQGTTPTYAVLGCGVDVCYPTENIELYNHILKNHGGIISEYPPGAEPLAWHFPMRNRIISGLSDKILVIEAKEKSGSLITVEWALEQGKDVMAVPGRVGETLSEGCNRLIKTGAGIVTSVKDILEDMQLSGEDKKEENVNEILSNLAKELRPVYQALEIQPKSLYEIMESLECDYGTVMSVLLKLQKLGLIEQPVDNYYAKI